MGAMAKPGLRYHRNGGAVSCEAKVQAPALFSNRGGAMSKASETSVSAAQSLEEFIESRIQDFESELHKAACIHNMKIAIKEALRVCEEWLEMEAEGAGGGANFVHGFATELLDYLKSWAGEK